MLERLSWHFASLQDRKMADIIWITRWLKLPRSFHMFMLCLLPVKGHTENDSLEPKYWFIHVTSVPVSQVNQSSWVHDARGTRRNGDYTSARPRSVADASL